MRNVPAGFSLCEKTFFYWSTQGTLAGDSNISVTLHQENSVGFAEASVEQVTTVISSAENPVADADIAQSPSALEPVVNAGCLPVKCRKNVQR